MAAGLISEDEFRQYAGYLFSTSREISDNWEIRESDRGEMYLYKRTNRLMKLKPSMSTERTQNKGKSYSGETSFRETEFSDMLEESDMACLGKDDAVTRDAVSDVEARPMNMHVSEACHMNIHVKDVPLVYEYNVVYSRSYNVPVLYFNVYRADGSLLSLNDVWDTVPDVYRERLQHERWTFLTQQEHPLLGRPFYQLHPCHTSDLMGKVFPSEGNKIGNYLISWLSAVGPVVGLDMPIKYGSTFDVP